MRDRGLLAPIVCLLLWVAILSGCSGAQQEVEQDPVQEAGSKTEAEDTEIATLYADFSAGNVVSHMESYDVDYTGELDAGRLADMLSEMTGLDFIIDVTMQGTGNMVVDWQPESTLISGIGDRVQHEEFYFENDESLGWFMLDSLARTIWGNMDTGEGELYYTMNGGEQLVVPGMPEWVAFLSEVPYAGSAAYRAARDNTYSDVFLVALQDVLGDARTAGKTFMEQGEVVVAGEKCILFALGTDTAAAFTVEAYFAVGPTGNVYQMEGSDGSWALIG